MDFGIQLGFGVWARGLMKDASDLLLVVGVFWG